MLIIQISELLLKNIEEEISLVIQKEKQFSLHLKCKDGNEHNKYAVAVMIGGRTGEHVPKNLSKIFNLFLTLPKCAIKCKVTRKRINRGAGYGLEILRIGRRKV